MSSQPRLVAFDMDGTLVAVSGAHRKGLREALVKVYGLETQIALKAHSGDTQPNVIRVICEKESLDPHLVESQLPEAVEVMSQAIIAQLGKDLRSEVLPGAVELLDRLEEQGHPLALVTGTVSTVADAILTRAGLRKYFPVSACGDEGDSRVELLELLLDRASDAYGLDARKPPVTVGDAVRDIQAAKEVGFRVIAVASGRYGERELAAHDPHTVLPNLEDHRAALRAIKDV